MSIKIKLGHSLFLVSFTPPPSAFLGLLGPAVCDQYGGRRSGFRQLGL